MTDVFVDVDPPPRSQRDVVFDLDHGRCVGCDTAQARNAGPWLWQVHHAIKAQELKRRGIDRRSARATSVCVLLCRRCHERHESRTAPIALERLPLRVLDAAAELGEWASDRVRWYHPPSDARRNRASERERDRV